jgi:hypothetical protein
MMVPLVYLVILSMACDFIPHTFVAVLIHMITHTQVLHALTPKGHDPSVKFTAKAEFVACPWSINYTIYYYTVSRKDDLLSRHIRQQHASPWLDHQPRTMSPDTPIFKPFLVLFPLYKKRWKWKLNINGRKERAGFEYVKRQRLDEAGATGGLTGSGDLRPAEQSVRMLADISRPRTRKARRACACACCVIRNNSRVSARCALKIAARVPNATKAGRGQTADASIYRYKHLYSVPVYTNLGNGLYTRDWYGRATQWP